MNELSFWGNFYSLFRIFLMFCITLLRLVWIASVERRSVGILNQLHYTWFIKVRVWIYFDSYFLVDFT